LLEQHPSHRIATSVTPNI